MNCWSSVPQKKLTDIAVSTGRGELHHLVTAENPAIRSTCPEFLRQHHGRQFTPMGENAIIFQDIFITNHIKLHNAFCLRLQAGNIIITGRYFYAG